MSLFQKQVIAQHRLVRWAERTAQGPKLLPRPTGDLQTPSQTLFYPDRCAEGGGGADSTNSVNFVPTAALRQAVRSFTTEFYFEELTCHSTTNCVSHRQLWQRRTQGGRPPHADDALHKPQ